MQQARRLGPRRMLEGAPVDPDVRALPRVAAELEVVSVVWARSVLVTEAALPLVLARAGKGGEEMAA